MKNQLLILLAIFTGMATANATVYTVSNDPNNPAQYDNFAEAHDAASAGDILYVFGSLTSYGNVDISKQLTIIGAGYNPENQYEYPTTFAVMSLRWESSSINSSGTTIMGVRADLNNEDYVEDIKISFCNISIPVRFSTGGAISYSYSTTANNWLIRNNVIRQLSGEFATNFIISNNILVGSIGSFQEPSIILLNNTLLGGLISFMGDNAFKAISYSNLLNNIFYGANVSDESCIAEYCTFYSNLSYLGDYTTFITGGCNNTGSDNKENTDPLFNSVSSTSFSYDDDYRLQSSSPCINAGTDGTDMGITGGQYPWPENADGTLDLTGMPPIPQIIQMDVINPIIPIDGTLTVKVKAHN